MAEYEVVLRMRVTLEDGDDMAQEFAEYLMYGNPDYIEDIEVLDVEEV